MQTRLECLSVGSLLLSVKGTLEQEHCRTMDERWTLNVKAARPRDLQIERSAWQAPANWRV